MSWPASWNIDDYGSVRQDPRLKGVSVKIDGLLASLAAADDSSGRWFIAPQLGVAMKVQRMTVSSPTTPFYGEILWLDDGRYKMSIHGVEHREGNQDLEQVRQWLRASLHQIVGPGRRRGSYSMTDEVVFKLMFQARNHLRARGDEPTQAKVMAAMGVQGDTKRVREWLKRLGFDSWEDFLRQP